MSYSIYGVRCVVGKINTMVGGVRYEWGVLDVLGVACYLLGFGKSGKRKAGRAGIFDFLFLNFFAT